MQFFCNGQDHDHSNSSTKSSEAGEENKVNQMSLKSREGSQTQHENTESSENLMSPKKTAYVDQSNKAADMVGEVSTVLASKRDSSSRSPSHMTKSATMSNGPAPRHQTMLGRTSVSKSFQN